MSHPLELYREGQFTTGWPTEETNRCGVTGQGLTFRYEVRLFGRALDARGFLLDNRALNLYWQRKYATPGPLVSCEVMASQALADFQIIAALEGVVLAGVEVRIYGGTYSAVTARWGEGCWSQARSMPGAPCPEPLEEAIEAGATVLGAIARVTDSYAEDRACAEV